MNTCNIIHFNCKYSKLVSNILLILYRQSVCRIQWICHTSCNNCSSGFRIGRFILCAVFLLFGWFVLKCCVSWFNQRSYNRCVLVFIWPVIWISIIQLTFKKKSIDFLWPAIYRNYRPNSSAKFGLIQIHFTLFMYTWFSYPNAPIIGAFNTSFRIESVSINSFSFWSNSTVGPVLPLKWEESHFSEYHLA